MAKTIKVNRVANFILVNNYECYEGEEYFIPMWLNVDKIVRLYPGADINGRDLTAIELGENVIEVVETRQEILALIGAYLC